MSLQYKIKETIPLLLNFIKSVVFTGYNIYEKNIRGVMSRKFTPNY